MDFLKKINESAKKYAKLIPLVSFLFSSQYAYTQNQNKSSFQAQQVQYQTQKQQTKNQQQTQNQIQNQQTQTQRRDDINYFLRASIAPNELMRKVKEYQDRELYGAAYGLILLKENDYENENIKSILNIYKENLKELIFQNQNPTIVNVQQFNNYTGRQGVENIIQSYIIERLVSNGVKVRKGGIEGDLIIEGDVINLSIETQTSIISKSVDVVLGYSKIPNPEYQTIAQQMSAVCNQANAAKERRNERITDYVLNGIAGLINKDDRAAAYNFTGAFISGMASTAGELESECKSLQAKLRSTDPYISQEQRGTAVIQIQDVTKTGNLEVVLRVIVPKTGDVIVSNNFSAIQSEHDRAWDGNDAAGIPPNPLELPPDSKMIRDLFQEIFDKLEYPLVKVINNFQNLMELRKAKDSTGLTKLNHCGNYYALGGDSTRGKKICGF